MASYVRLELRGGRSVTGQRMVSTANLAECWKPHVAVPLSADLDPDAVSSGYAMGWIRERYRDSTSLVWHNGAIDGFTSYLGFLPEQNLGLIVLNSMNPFPTGLYFYAYVLNLLLSRRLGLNGGVPSKVGAAWSAAYSGLLAEGAAARQVDRQRIQPYLGYYESGYQLLMDGPHLVLRSQSRRLELR